MLKFLVKCTDGLYIVFIFPMIEYLGLVVIIEQSIMQACLNCRASNQSKARVLVMMTTTSWPKIVFEQPNPRKGIITVGAFFQP